MRLNTSWPLNSEKLSLAYDSSDTVIDSLDLTIESQKVTVLVGGNGCGKSTLLKSFARLLKPISGLIFLEGQNINQLPGKGVARKMAILPQGPVAPEGLTVEQLVKQGRYPHQNWLQNWSKEDEYYVRKALIDTNMTAYSDRPIEVLSGGQRQRAWIAMALAQNTEILLLDEPTTYLDLTYQIEILDLLFELNREQKVTIVMVLHDLNLACRYADQLIALKDGGVYCQGAPEKVLNAEMVEAVFGMRCHIAKDPLFGTPMCVPHGKGRVIVDEQAEQNHTA
ncbi:ABC transporter ATP-binding protein [Marinomonas mediterranea]|uniref:ABC transporter ATP-binding protein n=1 Tax=Marinomonas mediterranea TaxID=119864 RepID=UPI00234AE7DE|nr:ABC transporter ATP-binding protein [Marinomonas mediterranea]WCN07777.1 ATP-binding cassette domain-containing protein [Marinomonas mediterranea]